MCRHSIWRSSLATYEVISPKRVSQTEIGGDENLVKYVAGQLLSQANLLEVPGAHPVEGGEELLNKVGIGVDGLTYQAF